MKVICQAYKGCVSDVCEHKIAHEPIIDDLSIGFNENPDGSLELTGDCICTDTSEYCKIAGHRVLCQPIEQSN